MKQSRFCSTAAAVTLPLTHSSRSPAPRYLGFLRSLSSTYANNASPQLPPRIQLSEADIDEAFLKGSGPGGQKINKTTSAVQLKHLPTNIVVKSQATRSRSQNRKIARQLLADKVEHALKNEKHDDAELAQAKEGAGVGAETGKSRVDLKVELKQKRKASRAKKAKRKYRKLAEGQTLTEEDAAVEDGAPQMALTPTDKT